MKNKIFVFLLAFFCLFSSFSLGSNFAFADDTTTKTTVKSFESIDGGVYSYYENITGYYNPYSISNLSLIGSANFRVTASYLYYASDDDTAYSTYVNFLNEVGDTYSFDSDNQPFFTYGSNYSSLEKLFLSSSYTVLEPTRNGNNVYYNIVYNVVLNQDILSFFIQNDQVDFFRFSTYANKRRLVLSVPVFTWIYDGFEYDLELFSSSVNSTSFQLFLSVPNYNINEFVFSLVMGYGDEDFYSNSSFTPPLCNLSVTNGYIGQFQCNRYYAYRVLLEQSYNLNFYSFNVSLDNILFSGSSLSDYGACFLIDFTFLQSYPYENNLSPSISFGSPDYQTCSWYDIPCHLGNALSYLIYEFPLTKPIYTFFKSVFGLISPIFDFFKLFVDIPYFSAILFLFFFVALMFFLIR